MSILYIDSTEIERLTPTVGSAKSNCFESINFFLDTIQYTL